MGYELIATYYIKGKKYDVYGCWDKETPENEFDFYDVQERETDTCINEGDPFYKEPYRNDVKELLEEIEILNR